jgi:hypothetical protein
LTAARVLDVAQGRLRERGGDLDLGAVAMGGSPIAAATALVVVRATAAATSNAPWIAQRQASASS